MATLSPYIFNQYFDNNGDPLVGGKVFAYEANTLTFKAIFTDAAGTISSPNPAILDSAGRLIIYLEDGAYDFQIKDSADNLIDTVDDVQGGGGGSGFDSSTVDNYSELRALVGGVTAYVFVGGHTVKGDGGEGPFYWNPLLTTTDNNGTILTPSAAPAMGRWVRLFTGDVNVKWFTAEGDYLSANGSINVGATDDTTAINAALAFADTIGFAVTVPEGAYLVSDVIVCPVTMTGAYKPQNFVNAIHASTSYTTANDFKGSWLVWDKSTLTPTSVYIQNTTENLLRNIKFRNMGFLSLSNGGATEGGGILLNSMTNPTNEKHDFDFKAPLEYCMVLNFVNAVKMDFSNGLTFNNNEFRGCQQPFLLGSSAGVRADQTTFNKNVFENCGDSSNGFIKLNYCDSVYFNECIFDTTSEIVIRDCRDILSINQCFYSNQTLGATSNLILLTNDGDKDVDLISFKDSAAGVSGGDIDISNGAGQTRLVVQNGVQKDINRGTLPLVLIGSPQNGAITGTGARSFFTDDEFRILELRINKSGVARIISIENDDGTASTDGSLNIFGGSDLSGVNAANISLFGNDHVGQGQSNVTIKSGTGSNSGDIELVTGSGDIKLSTGASQVTEVSSGTFDVVNNIRLTFFTETVGNGTVNAGAVSAGSFKLRASFNGDTTVNTTACITTSLIFFSAFGSAGDDIGVLRLKSVNAGNFVLHSLESTATAALTTETPIVLWWLINPI